MTGTTTNEPQHDSELPDVQPAVAEQGAPQSTHISNRLPFGFAKRFGVLVEGTAEQLTLIHKEGVRGDVIMEAQRFLSAPFRLEVVNDDEFDRRLGLAYRVTAQKPWKWWKVWAMKWTWPAWPIPSRKRKTCWSRRAMRRSFA